MGGTGRAQELGVPPARTPCLADDGDAQVRREIAQWLLDNRETMSHFNHGTDDW